MTQERAEGTRNRILKAAEASFAESGYDAAGVAEICQRAGLSKGAFYHHFPSKKDVFLALLQGWLAGLESQLAKIRLVAGTVPEALTVMASEVGEAFEEIRGLVPMFLEFWNQAARDPEVWQILIAPYRHFRDLFAEMITKGIEEGSLKEIPPAIASQVIVSFAVGTLVQSGMDPEGVEWEMTTREGVRLFLQGLERKA